MMAMSAVADRKAVAVEVAALPRPDHHHAVCLRQRGRNAEGHRSGGARRHPSPRLASKAADQAVTSATASHFLDRRLMPRQNAVPVEALAALRRRLSTLPINFQLLRFHLALARKRLRWIGATVRDPTAQHVLTHMQVAAGLDQTTPALSHQPNSFKFDPSAKQSSSRLHPSFSSKHLN